MTNDTIRRVKPTKGLKPTECDADVVFTTGGLSAEPKPGIIPDDAGLLLEFNTEGGVPYPKGPVPEDDDDDVGGAVGIDGVASVTGLGGGSSIGLGGGSIGLDCVGGVGDDDFGVVVDDDDDDDGKMQEPVLGFVLTKVAVPPKSQLVGAGFFW